MEKTKILTVVAVLSVIFVAASALAKNEGGQGKSQEKKAAHETAENSSGKADAKLYRETAKETNRDIKAAATELKVEAKDAEKAKVSAELEQIATEQEQATEENADAIEAVESRNKFKKLLVGTDYKNLGQLRSGLVQNRNQIRKLTKLIGETQDPATVAELQTQLAALAAERETIKTLITTNESGFSLLGWVSKFLSGYQAIPLDGDEEDDLDGEIDSALEQDGGELEDASDDAGSDTVVTE